MIIAQVPQTPVKSSVRGTAVPYSDRDQQEGREERSERVDRYRGRAFDGGPASYDTRSSTNDPTSPPSLR
jgi:hypothetical protein